MAKVEPDPGQILEEAARPEASKPTPIACAVKKIVSLARKWLAGESQVKEGQVRFKEAREAILQFLPRFHLDACRDLGRYEPSVLIDCGKMGTMRATFGHNWKSIPLSQEDAVKEAAGERFPDWFERAVTLQVKRAVAGDPEKLKALVTRLTAALGADEFLDQFEAVTTVEVKEAFTQTRHCLSDEKLDDLEKVGVRQSATLARAS